MGVVFVACTSDLYAWFPPKPAEAPPPPPDYFDPDSAGSGQTLDEKAVENRMEPGAEHAPGFVRGVLGFAEKVIGAISSFAIGAFVPSGFHVFG